MRNLLVLLMMAFCLNPAWAATGIDLTAMTADTHPTVDDLLYMVNDPLTTHGPRKVTLLSLFTSFGTDYITGLTNDVTPTGDDLIMTIDSPGGTAVNKKVTLTNLFNTFSPATGWTLSGSNIYSTYNVGIGVASPTVALHVVGNARVTGLVSCTSSIVTDAQGNFSCGSGGGGGGAGIGTVNPGTSGLIAYYPGTGSTVDDLSILKTDGTNLGISTATPGKTLDITGTLRTSGAATIGGALAVTGAVTGSNLSGTNTGDQTNITGNAATVTTNANLTGPIASSGNATSITAQTGTGTTFVMNTSPTLVTPVLGVASATNLGIGTTLNGSASLAVMNGNVGVGTWKPVNAIDNRANQSIGYTNISAPTGGLIVSGNTGIGTSLPTALLDVGLAHAFQVDSNGMPTINGGASPITSSFGNLSSKSNAWASGRGALQFFDGTGTTYLLGALVSDVPINGQVPTWTNGAITWETPSSGGSASITAADTQIIFSDGANSPAGDAGFVYNKVTNTATADAFQTTAIQRPYVSLDASGTDSAWMMGVSGNGDSTDNDFLRVGIGTTMPDIITKVTVDRTGNVGIGSTSPNNNLDVGSGTAQAALFKMTTNPVRGYSLTANDTVGVGTWMGNVINVRAWGATGDGSTDDTTAIQNAMNAAAGNAILYFPKPSVYYKITTTLRLSSNLTIRGDNSKIHMPAQASEAAIQAMFDTNNGATTSNVDIAGLYIESVNTTVGGGGSGYFTGSNTSYVMGINAHNTSDIRVHDITMDALAYGMKFDTTLNTHLFFNNIKIINSGQPFYGSHITDGYFTNMYLDSTGYTGTDGHLHSFYFETNVQDIFFNNVSMNNTAGGCIQIYESGGTAAKNIQGKNLSCATAADFMIIWTGTTDVRIDGWRVTGATKVFNIDDAHDLQFSHGYVELKQYLIDDGGSTASSHVVIDNLVMDASTKTADAGDFLQGEDIGGSYFTLENSHIYGITANNRVVYNSGVALTNLRISNNDFYFAATPADNPVSLRNASTTAIVNNNRFINQGTATTNAVIHAPITLGQVVATDNQATGFPKMTSGSDTGTVATNNFVNGVGASLDTQFGNIGIGTWRPTTMLEVGLKSLNVTTAGNVGIGSSNPGRALDVGPGLGVRFVGIGTTVPQQVCISNGKIGYYNGTWASSCTTP